MIESKYLQDNIENIRRLLELPTLRRFETRSLGRLLKLSRVREYADGEGIIREGDRDPWLYVLLSGRVRILKDGQEIGRVETSTGTSCWRASPAPSTSCRRSSCARSSPGKS